MAANNLTLVFEGSKITNISLVSFFSLVMVCWQTLKSDSVKASKFPPFVSLQHFSLSFKGRHLREVGAALRRPRAASDGAKLSGHRHPPRHDSGRETLEIPTVQRFPEGSLFSVHCFTFFISGENPVYDFDFCLMSSFIT